MGDMADLLNDSYLDEMDNMDAVGNACFQYTKRYYKQHLTYYKIKGDGECPRCDGPTVLRNGKFGKFYGCVDFPNCKGSRCYEGR